MAQFVAQWREKKLEPTLRLGEVLLDKPVIAKMRDKYPLQMFCFENYLALVDQEPVAALYVPLW